jgi:hypothetical protein
MYISFNSIEFIATSFMCIIPQTRCGVAVAIREVSEG